MLSSRRSLAMWLRWFWSCALVGSSFDARWGFLAAAGGGCVDGSVFVVFAVALGWVREVRSGGFRRGGSCSLEREVKLWAAGYGCRVRRRGG
jgi:hypothetical protein